MEEGNKPSGESKSEELNRGWIDKDILKDDGVKRHLMYKMYFSTARKCATLLSEKILKKEIESFNDIEFIILIREVVLNTYIPFDPTSLDYHARKKKTPGANVDFLPLQISDIADSGSQMNWRAEDDSVIDPEKFKSTLKKDFCYLELYRNNLLAHITLLMSKNKAGNGLAEDVTKSAITSEKKWNSNCGAFVMGIYKEGNYYDWCAVEFPGPEILVSAMRLIVCGLHYILNASYKRHETDEYSFNNEKQKLDSIIETVSSAHNKLAQYIIRKREKVQWVNKHQKQNAMQYTKPEKLIIVKFVALREASIAFYCIKKALKEEGFLQNVMLQSAANGFMLVNDVLAADQTFCRKNKLKLTPLKIVEDARKEFYCHPGVYTLIKEEQEKFAWTEISWSHTEMQQFRDQLKEIVDLLVEECNKL